ncbi:MAG: (2Fe-2S)-binding protein [Bryobacterales bacterium]|nr:(2Fe-2S)-binding protein [Bryobacterales bacterium]
MELRVNGRTVQVQVDPERSLLSVLREELELTGCKYGCGEGQCGSCTVQLDGSPVRSCLTPVRAAAGKHVRTVEGLESNGELHPMQKALLEAEAMQCGYCTSGMLMTAVSLLEKKPHPDDAEIRRAMQGNICRCGTYPRIVAAVRMAAAMQQGGSHA